MLVPADTPKGVINRVRDDTAKVLIAPEVHQRFVGRGLEVYANTPAEFETYLNSEIARWAKVVQAAGVRLD
jgi:tripartite-type tricarboxylate transporter receptor subunit TctC